jgi:SAM-dependent methyltransferase
MTNETKILNSKNFASFFDETLSSFVKKKIELAQLTYREISSEERDVCLMKIIDTLLDEYLVYSGEHRHGQWDIGWSENLAEYTAKKNPSSVKPKYFGKYPINRLERRFVKAISEDYEVRMLGILQYWLFEKYLRDYANVYEFGCGTGHNLLRLREVNKKAELWGLDWAESSQKLIAKLKSDKLDTNINGANFDFFKPNHSFRLKNNSAIFTVAALEQIGDRYKEFVDYLIKNKPSLCLHIEPVAELLEPDKNLLDYLSVAYFKKRKYLSGFLDYLKVLEKGGSISILDARRSYIGSFFVDGYSIIVWRVN